MRFILVLFLVFVSFAASNVASPALAKTIEISPAYFDITVGKEGNEQSFDLFITNKTDKKIKVDLSSLDFKQTDPFGAIGFLGKEIGNYTYSLSSFLTYDKDSLEIESNKREKVVVNVVNRQDLSPGGHYAAVIVRQTPTQNSKQTVVSPALSSLIYLNKRGGERYNLSFKDVNFPKFPIVFSQPSTYLITLQNDGNVHLIPFGTADITDMFGRLIYKGVINEGSLRILPQSRRYIPVYSKKVATSIPFSINKLTIEGRDSLNKTKFSYEELFIYVNLWLVGGLTVALMIFVWAGRKYLKNQKSRG